MDLSMHILEARSMPVLPLAGWFIVWTVLAALEAVETQVKISNVSYLISPIPAFVTDLGLEESSVSSY
jgi:hypothetical protein